MRDLTLHFILSLEIGFWISSIYMNMIPEYLKWTIFDKLSGETFLVQKYYTPVTAAKF